MSWLKALGAILGVLGSLFALFKRTPIQQKISSDGKSKAEEEAIRSGERPKW